VGGNYLLLCEILLLLLAVYCLLSAVNRLPSAVNRLPSAAYCILFALCCLLFAPANATQYTKPRLFSPYGISYFCGCLVVPHYTSNNVCPTFPVARCTHAPARWKYFICAPPTFTDGVAYSEITLAPLTSMGPLLSWWKSLYQRLFVFNGPQLMHLYPTLTQRTSIIYIKTYTGLPLKTHTGSYPLHRYTMILGPNTICIWVCAFGIGP
jgi:hypothetical protein